MSSQGTVARKQISENDYIKIMLPRWGAWHRKNSDWLGYNTENIIKRLMRLYGESKHDRYGAEPPAIDWDDMEAELVMIQKAWQIMNLAYPGYARVIKCRYEYQYTWKEIGQDIGKTDRTAKNWFNDGLEIMERLL